MHNKVLLFACSILLLCFSGCSKDSAPENEMPTLTIGEATDISRKTAIIYGNISVPEGSEVRNCGFLYSTVSTLPEAESKTVSITLQGASNAYTTTLTGLTPNTKYYYCLYANSGYTTTRSNVREFTTAADGVPALEATTSISATETSLTVASKLSDDGGSDIQKFGFAYKVSGSAEAEKMIEAARKENDGRYTFTITGLTAETSYEVRAFATNSKGTGYGEMVTLLTSIPELPIVQMEAKAPGNTSIEISAEITNENDLSAGITEVGFCWSKEKEEPTTADTKIMAELSNKNFSALLSGLSPETKYYVRAYAINKKTKTGYSSVISFTTTKSSAPTLIATTSISVEETTATVQGGILNEGGHAVTKIGFAYKQKGDATEIQKEVPASALQTDGTFRYTLTGLEAETNYEVRAFATNAKGTGYGDKVALLTSPPELPTLQMESKELGINSIQLSAKITNVKDLSAGITEVGFCWSKDKNVPTTADAKVITDLKSKSFSALLNGLAPNTKYYVRAYAINKKTKIGYSTVVNFTTAKSSAPTLDVTTSITVEETAATVQSRILDDGGHSVTKFGFAYKLKGDAAETQKEVPASSLQADGTFRFTLTGLSSERTYEVRAFAINSAGTGYGTFCSTTTLALQAPQVSVDAEAPGMNTVSVTGVVQSAGGKNSTVKEVGFCWSSSNAKPTIADNKLKSTLDGTVFGNTISGLKTETKYYIRAYAVNEAKVGYSDVKEITTAVSNIPDEGDIVSPDKDN